jgi:hypothetical protein
MIWLPLYSPELQHLIPMFFRQIDERFCIGIRLLALA